MKEEKENKKMTPAETVWNLIILALAGYGMYLGITMIF